MKKFIILLTSLIIMLTFTTNVFAGDFVNDGTGVKFDLGGGNYLKDGWAWIDFQANGESFCYYFDPEGNLLVNTVTPDGYNVDGGGRWVVRGQVQTKTIPRLGILWIGNGSDKIDDAETVIIDYKNPSYGNNIFVGLITNMQNTTLVDFNHNGYVYHGALKMSGQGSKVVFNSMNTTSLEFCVTTDDIDKSGAYVLTVYRNGRFSERLNHIFDGDYPTTFTFGKNEIITIELTSINANSKQKSIVLYNSRMM